MRPSGRVDDRASANQTRIRPSRSWLAIGFIHYLVTARRFHEILDWVTAAGAVVIKK